MGTALALDLGKTEHSNTKRVSHFFPKRFQTDGSVGSGSAGSPLSFPPALWRLCRTSRPLLFKMVFLFIGGLLSRFWTTRDGRPRAFTGVLFWSGRSVRLLGTGIQFFLGGGGPSPRSPLVFPSLCGRLFIQLHCLENSQTRAPN